ncbi:MAG TPA: biotin/lipoyl-containing protein [Thermoanaerobaculia bacterium]|nr:biotin/lipoyl-containing protein [Thermoanaerobaculia bacterium]
MELIARRRAAAGKEAGPDEPAERVRVVRGPGEDGSLEVAVGSRTYRVDAARVGGQGSLYLYSLRIGGAQHEIAVSALSSGVYRVSSREGAFLVEVADPLAYLAAQSAGGKGTKRRQQVTAYMPGRVVAILVAEGEEVAAGQGVLVLEAMKMQNEIQAEQQGTVRRLLVEPGQSVDGGDPLFELE